MSRAAARVRREGGARRPDSFNTASKRPSSCEGRAIATDKNPGAPKERADRATSRRCAAYSAAGVPRDTTRSSQARSHSARNRRSAIHTSGWNQYRAQTNPARSCESASPRATWASSCLSTTRRCASDQSSASSGTRITGARDPHVRGVVTTELERRRMGLETPASLLASRRTRSQSAPPSGQEAAAMRRSRMRPATSQIRTARNPTAQTMESQASPLCPPNRLPMLTRARPGTGEIASAPEGGLDRRTSLAGRTGETAAVMGAAPTEAGNTRTSHRGASRMSAGRDRQLPSMTSRT